MENNAYSGLRKALLEIAYLGQASTLLNWDMEINLPKLGHKARAEAMGYIAGLNHGKFISRKFEEILMRAVELEKSGNLGSEDSFIVLKTLSDFEKARRLPSKFVEASERLYGEAYEVWVNARAKSDFSLFEPYLTKIIATKRQEAEYIGYANPPYDALMDNYEPGITCDAVFEIFDQLKQFLVPFIEKIKHSQVKIDKEFLARRFPIDKQDEFIRMVVRAMGFDFDRGRLDVTIHPFCTSLHPTDVRITTRFDEKDFLNQALMSAIHEAGHGLYDQGLREEYFGTPLGDAISLGIHESQSRMWENLVGRSLSFWKYFFPKLQKAFPEQLRGVSPEQFYKAINFVEPGFIRVDADEVTYNLHVIFRVEMERDLIEGNLEVKDCPYVWNKKMKEYFGLDVPDDARGILQDVHWSGGLVGYYHTYALGNIYSAQFNHAAHVQISGLENKIAKGEFLELGEWLRKNIHVHGELYLPEHLILRVTGEKPSPKYFIDYLNKKYSEIYEL